MTYELAKQLKDAGFRQDTKFGIWEDATDCLPLEECPKTWGDTVACPTLSELIEACVATKPDELICIGHAMYDKENFHAAFYENELVVGIMPKQTISVFGKTLEEAVANLWLKLNQ